jgi:heat shock protein HslJ
MVRRQLAAALMTAVALAALPVGAAAQDGLPTPEGPEWRLTGVRAGNEIGAVPFGTSATLRLDGGQASGSGGCNSFTGSYQVAGPTLTFVDEVASTLKLCTDDVQTIEDAYFAALPEVAGWIIVDDVLQLRDAGGRTMLTFEVPTISLTPSELAALVETIRLLRADLESLRADLRGQAVPKLRARVARMDAQLRELREAGTVDEAEPTAPEDASGFSAAEQVLLEGIPPRIGSTCVPLRRSIPPGAVAALSCAPNTIQVDELVYFLMDADDASAFFEATMTANEVRPGTSTRSCANGRSSVVRAVGGGQAAEGCFISSEGDAILHILEPATDCRQLRVGETRLEAPMIYSALVGSSDDIAGAWAWATRSPRADGITGITVPIERPGARRSPACPS